ncbi:hypothetical protein LX32DRAFT_240068 [Colletotrichum zoysiae]|uniref:Uncharacterized protein n=1 Tax=Colletotrichum zoysiae TaxID=1216348 RepID=A0AAD9LUK4_9PEZI|nr:hypothetical protein LX32DRAFT_240068 [Colletotrichum zoysiae]
MPGGRRRKTAYNVPGRFTKLHSTRRRSVEESGPRCWPSANSFHILAWSWILYTTMVQSQALHARTMEWYLGNKEKVRNVGKGRGMPAIRPDLTKVSSQNEE